MAEEKIVNVKKENEAEEKIAALERRITELEEKASKQTTGAGFKRTNCELQTSGMDI